MEFSSAQNPHAYKITGLDTLDGITNKYHRILDWRCQTCNNLGAEYYAQVLIDGTEKGQRICTNCLIRKFRLTENQIRTMRTKFPEDQGNG